MKKLLVLVMIFGFAVAPAFAADMVTLSAKNGDVSFNHKVHGEKMECAVCHGEGTPGKVELDKKSAHDLCKGCHADKGAGPTKCGDCHKK